MLHHKRLIVRGFALITGLAFLLGGIGGFFPLTTTTPHHHDPNLALDTSYGRLLGLYPVNLLHNLVHLSFGIWGLWACGNVQHAQLYARGTGVILTIFAVMGLLPGLKTTFGLLPLFSHTIWLHALEAVAALYIGFFALPHNRVNYQRN